MLINLNYRTKKPRQSLTAVQAKALDKKILKKFGISTLVLMENAGKVVSVEAMKILKNKHGQVAIFCGLGNNGGDGFCVARHLLAAGIKSDVYLTGKIRDVKNEAKINLDILLRLKQRIIHVDQYNLDSINVSLKKYGLIIDALLGVGGRGRMRPVYAELIGMINASRAYVLSVDIPSGLNATSGKLLGVCIKADQTVTFVRKKRGMIYAAGPSQCGQILVRDIGLPNTFLF